MHPKRLSFFFFAFSRKGVGADEWDSLKILCSHVLTECPMIIIKFPFRLHSSSYAATPWVSGPFNQRYPIFHESTRIEQPIIKHWPVTNRANSLSICL